MPPAACPRCRVHCHANVALADVIMGILCQVVEDGYEFFSKRQLVTLFSAPNYCGEFDNAGAMMSVDETLMCSFQVMRVEPLAPLSLDFTDTQTCGEEAEVQLRWFGDWPTCYSSTRKQEQEGQQISTTHQNQHRVRSTACLHRLHAQTAAAA